MAGNFCMSNLKILVLLSIEVRARWFHFCVSTVYIYLTQIFAKFHGPKLKNYVVAVF
jgi:hypothetical protein